MSESVRVSEKKSEAAKEDKKSQTRTSEYLQPVNSSIDRILFLQRTIGNQAVGRLIKSGVLQAKLKVADQVMRIPGEMAMEPDEDVIELGNESFEQQERLQAGGGSTNCNEKPTLTDSSLVPVNVTADNVIEFVNQYESALGGNAHMTPDINYNLEINTRGLVTKVNLTLNTSIYRPRWMGGRNVSPKDRDLITKAVTLIKDHEVRHRDIAREKMVGAVCAMLGKTTAKALNTLNDYECNKMAIAQENLDMREGLLTVVMDSNGQATDVKLGPVSQRPNYRC